MFNGGVPPLWLAALSGKSRIRTLVQWAKKVEVSSHSFTCRSDNKTNTLQPSAFTAINMGLINIDSNDPKLIVALGFAGVGGVYLALQTISFLRLLLSLFILPGKSVSIAWLRLSGTAQLIHRISCQILGPKVLGPSLRVPLMGSASSSPRSLLLRVST